MSDTLFHGGIHWVPATALDELREWHEESKSALCDADDLVITLESERDAARAALQDMLSGWRYIRQTFGDLPGVGWDRAEQKAEHALRDGTPTKGEG